MPIGFFVHLFRHYRGKVIRSLYSLYS